jgi:hypothetical protein
VAVSLLVRFGDDSWLLPMCNFLKMCFISLSLSLSLSLSTVSLSLRLSVFLFFFCLAKILSLSLPLFSFFLCLFPPLRVSFIFLIFSFLGSQQRTETLERQGKGRWSLHPRARENLMKRYHVVGRLQKGHAVSVNY